MNGTLIQRILVPTDGSDESILAARYAAEIAACERAEVTVLNALEASGVTQFVTYSVSATGDLRGDMRETGESALEKTRQPFLAANVPVHSKIIRPAPIPRLPMTMRS